MKRIILNGIRSFLKKKLIEDKIKHLSKGRDISNFWVKLLPPHHSYPKKSCRNYISPEGISFLLDISDLVDWYLYFGVKEPAHEKLYKLNISGSTYFDVGTNIGAVLLKMAKINKDGTNHGFEPDAYNFQKCQQNIGLNDLKNIKINNIGLGAKVEEAFIFVPDDRNRGMNRIQKVDDTITQLNKVQIETLDNYVDKNNICSVDLIKIDTEGYEMNVLLGAQNILRSFKPILFIELDNKNLIAQQSTAAELVAFLEEYNYEVSRAEDGFSLSSSFDYLNCHFDIIAR